jgi:hypothetical protein
MYSNVAQGRPPHPFMRTLGMLNEPGRFASSHAFDRSDARTKAGCAG